MSPITVLLVEDHEIVREGTRRLLEQAPAVIVVGEAADGEMAVALALKLRPDVVVMDIRMPRLNGMEATQRIKSALPDTKVVILSAYDDDEYVFPLLEAGATGYLLKTSNGQDLIQAIVAVHAGQSVLDSHITGKVVGHLTNRAPSRAGRPPEQLTDRELEVLQAVANGMSNKEVAEALSISISTVQVHLRNLFGKLDVDSRTAAVTAGLRSGLITLHDTPAARHG